MSEIGIVAARSANDVIGRNGRLAWTPIKKDMARMHSIIDGHVIIVGRKTMDELPQHWDCQYLTVSTTRPSCERSVEDALKKAQALWPDKSVYFLGGTRIFREAFRFATKLYLTTIDKEVDGDAYFPRIPSYWAMMENESVDELLIFEEYENTFPTLPVPKGLY